MNCSPIWRCLEVRGDLRLLLLLQQGAVRLLQRLVVAHQRRQLGLARRRRFDARLIHRRSAPRSRFSSAILSLNLAIEVLELRFARRSDACASRVHRSRRGVGRRRQRALELLRLDALLAAPRRCGAAAGRRDARASDFSSTASSACCAVQQFVLPVSGDVGSGARRASLTARRRSSGALDDVGDRPLEQQPPLAIAVESIRRATAAAISRVVQALHVGARAATAARR